MRQFGEGKHTENSYMISRSFSGIGKQERHCMSHLSCSNGRFNGQGVSGGTVLLLCADSVG